MSTDLIIVGAGAAGIGAAKTAARLGLSWTLMEASHRVGGRAYTESPTPDIQFDLGCHWLHTAHENPLSQLAVGYGFETANHPWRPSFFADGGWLDETAPRAYLAFEEQTWAALSAMVRAGGDPAVFDAVDTDNAWSAFFCYWISLMASVDPDQTAAADFLDFQYGEQRADWPLRQGLGNLIARFAADTPVRLNTAVHEIDARGKRVVVKTNRGDLEAAAVLVTVSTGVLNAGDIRFRPSLPDWKRQAIQDAPLGNHNRICVIYDRDVFGDYEREHAIVLDGGDGPMYFEIRPFGLHYAVASTGGRFADWLERAGEDASTAYARERLGQMFGSGIDKHVQKTVVSAWRGDPWVKGAYSAVRPGCHGARAALAAPVDDRVFFAGEATSGNYMQTAHGAYISGVRAVLEVEPQVGRAPPVTDPEKLAWALAAPGN